MERKRQRVCNANDNYIIYAYLFYKVFCEMMQSMWKLFLQYTVQSTCTPTRTRDNKNKKSLF